jgi:hypothetical protein
MTFAMSMTAISQQPRVNPRWIFFTLSLEIFNDSPLVGDFRFGKTLE